MKVHVTEAYGFFDGFAHVAVEEDTEDELVTDNMVRGYHIYQNVWTPAVGERLQYVREEGNVEDRCAFFIANGLEIVGS